MDDAVTGINAWTIFPFLGSWPPAHPLGARRYPKRLDNIGGRLGKYPGVEPERGTLASLIPRRTKVLVAGYLNGSGDGGAVIDARSIIVGELNEAGYSGSPCSRIFS